MRMASVAYKELKKSGMFVLPGFAKFIVVKKPATPERKGINPFTKEPTVFKAKPARKTLKVRPVKAAKDAVLTPPGRGAFRAQAYLRWGDGDRVPGPLQP